ETASGDRQRFDQPAGSGFPDLDPEAVRVIVAASRNPAAVRADSAKAYVLLPLQADHPLRRPPVQHDGTLAIVGYGDRLTVRASIPPVLEAAGPQPLRGADPVALRWSVLDLHGPAQQARRPISQQRAGRLPE